MERYTIALIVLFGALVLASVFLKEGFVDASGTDTSGNIISLSLADLITILAGQGSSAPAAAPVAVAAAPEVIEEESEFDSQFITSLRGEIAKDVRKAVRSQLQEQAAGSQTILTDSCIDSVADQQGTDWMRYIPGKNPADYVRKDSIPCYSCSLP